MSQNIDTVFLAEALGHASARDVIHPTTQKVLLSQGSLIDPRIVGLLAAHGFDRITVFKKPRIAILVIAGDLISPGLPQQIGKGYDFSVPSLKAALDMMKIRPVFVRRIKGGLKKMSQMVSFALNHSDIVVLVFKEFEHGLQEFQDFLGQIDAQLIFYGQKRPSKELALSHKYQKQIYCLPYDSESIFESFEKLLQPSIWKFMGRKTSLS